jgi:hypothetical protein
MSSSYSSAQRLAFPPGPAGRRGAPEPTVVALSVIGSSITLRDKDRATGAWE